MTVGSGRRDVAAALVAVVVLVAAVGLAQRNRALSLARAEARDWAAVNDVVVGVHLALEAAVDAVEQAAGVAAAGVDLPPIAPPSLGVTIGLLEPDGPSGDASGLSAADLERPEVARVLARATDAGTLAFSAPVELDAGLRAVLAAPVYDGPVSPGTLLERRAAHRGWAVATLDLGAMAEPYLPEGAGARLSVGDRSFVAGPGPPRADVGKPIDLHGYRIDVRAGSLEPPGVAAGTWAILAGGALAAVAAGAGAAWLSRRDRRQVAALRRGEQQAQVVAEVAPIVQHSLDLADVLPAIAVQLRDHFGLTGVHLTTAGPAGSEIEVFGLGPRAVDPPAPALGPPERLGAGEATVLALQRGGRGVARLELVAGRALSGEELRSLRVLSELVTAAVVNANLYAAQQDAVRRLRELDALKTVFLSTASHELRTPATAISGFASLLEDRWGDFPEDQRAEMVGRIAANARSLSAVVEDLLDFSLLDRRDQPLAVEPLHLGDVVDAVVGRLGLLFADHAIEVVLGDPPPVLGERNALERVITNLLTNAAKFSPAGSTITVEVDGTDGGGRIRVRDEGPGVPPEERSRVFTRFYRGEGDAVVQTRGVGIGLAVVAELVERMGGAVTVDDAPGGGARFTVWLPPAGSGAGEAIAERGRDDATAR